MAGDITDWAAISSGFQMLPWLGGHFVAGEGQLVGRSANPSPSGGDQERDCGAGHTGLSSSLWG